MFAIVGVQLFLVQFLTHPADSLGKRHTGEYGVFDATVKSALSNSFKQANDNFTSNGKLAKYSGCSLFLSELEETRLSVATYLFSNNEVVKHTIDGDFTVVGSCSKPFNRKDKYSGRAKLRLQLVCTLSGDGGRAARDEVCKAAECEIQPQQMPEKAAEAFKRLATPVLCSTLEISVTSAVNKYNVDRSHRDSIRMKNVEEFQHCLSRVERPTLSKEDLTNAYDTGSFLDHNGPDKHLFSSAEDGRRMNYDFERIWTVSTDCFSASVSISAHLSCLPTGDGVTVPKFETCLTPKLKRVVENMDMWEYPNTCIVNNLDLQKEYPQIQHLYTTTQENLISQGLCEKFFQGATYSLNALTYVDKEKLNQFQTCIESIKTAPLPFRFKKNEPGYYELVLPATFTKECFVGSMTVAVKLNCSYDRSQKEVCPDIPNKVTGNERRWHPHFCSIKGLDVKHSSFRIIRDEIKKDHTGRKSWKLGRKNSRFYLTAENVFCKKFVSAAVKAHNEMNALL